ncbi:hypothetical protein PINS_up005897 [Pythium insidiosum]|nr:hypothetical protein PINS_up005897 [Pythium insidiosum]
MVVYTYNQSPRMARDAATTTRPQRLSSLRCSSSSNSASVPPPPPPLPPTSYHASVGVTETKMMQVPLTPQTPRYTWYRCEKFENSVDIQYIVEPHKPLAAATTHRRFVIRSAYVRACLKEFLGAWVTACFGFGVNNQVRLSHGEKGSALSINLGWGIAVMLGVHIAAHLNPVVTLTLATYRRTPWRNVPGFWLAQTLGAFLGAWTIFLLNYETLQRVDPKRTFTRANFATFPSDQVSNYTAFYTEFLATILLAIGIFAKSDEKNRPVGPYGVPGFFFYLTAGISMAFNMNTGAAINPARDFGPRVFLALAGWGREVFTVRHYYFWIPIVAPFTGGIVGGGIYTALIEMHHPSGR